MTTEQRLKYLRIMLVVLGATALGLYPLMVLWPAGWAWHEGVVNYQMMLVGVYATLGVFLLLAARDPMANLSLIWFTVWSSVVHAGVMTVQALTEPGHMGHFVGDIPALLIGSAVLAFLTPRRSAVPSAETRS
jgi:hypothetical protein